MVADVLAIHGGDGGVSMFELPVLHKAIPPAVRLTRCICGVGVVDIAIIATAHDVRRVDERTERGKGVMNSLFINVINEVAYEEVRTDVLRYSIDSRLRYADRFGK